MTDPAFREFFNSFGAYEYLRTFQLQLARCDMKHMDVLLSSSRRALCVVSAFEINKLGQALTEYSNGSRLFDLVCDGIFWQMVKLLNGLARYVT